MAGAAACPSETVETPATFSSSWARCCGRRTRNSREGRSVVPLAGEPTMPGAPPAVTVIDSSRLARIWSGPAAASEVTSVGWRTRPPGSVTSTSNGGAGFGRPDEAAVAVRDRDAAAAEHGHFGPDDGRSIGPHHAPLESVERERRERGGGERQKYDPMHG